VTERPPPVLDYSPAAPARPSFAATTVGVLLHPTLAFRLGAAQSDARRFARVHTLIASLMLGTATHLYVAYLAQVEWFGDYTGHWSDGWFWIPTTIAWYVLFEVISRIVQRRQARHEEANESCSEAPDRQAAAHLHCAHLVPPAIMMLLSVLVLYRLDWSSTIEAGEPRYGILLASELAISAAYFILTFRIGSRGSRWAAATA